MGGNKAEGSSIFSEVPTDGTRNNGHTLKIKNHIKFKLNTENASLLQVVRLPSEVVESPSLEIFRPRLDMVLDKLPWVALLRLSRWVKMMHVGYTRAECKQLQKDPIILSN